MNALKVRIVNKSQWPDPTYATEASAGMDLRANITEPIVLKPLERVLVPTGIFIAQMVVARHERVEWEDVEVLSETERGAGGWGSTGKK